MTCWSVLFVGSIFTGLSLQSSLNVSVYYEALCYDSVQFIKKQLYPNYSRFKDDIYVDFVPYGKAIHNNVNGSWVFDCQHGENECYGNLMQACGLSQTEDQDARVNFVNCVMSADNPSANGSLSECAKNNNLSWKAMVECSQNGTGYDLLAEYGDQTLGVQPNIIYIPTIIYNDVYNRCDHASSLTDFCGTVTRILNPKISVSYPHLSPYRDCPAPTTSFALPCCPAYTWDNCTWYSSCRDCDVQIRV